MPQEGNTDLGICTAHNLPETQQITVEASCVAGSILPATLRVNSRLHPLLETGNICFGDLGKNYICYITLIHLYTHVFNSFQQTLT